MAARDQVNERIQTLLPQLLMLNNRLLALGQEKRTQRKRMAEEKRQQQEEKASRGEDGVKRKRMRSSSPGDNKVTPSSSAAGAERGKGRYSGKGERMGRGGKEVQPGNRSVAKEGRGMDHGKKSNAEKPKYDRGQHDGKKTVVKNEKQGEKPVRVMRNKKIDLSASPVTSTTSTMETNSIPSVRNEVPTTNVKSETKTEKTNKQKDSVAMNMDVEERAERRNELVS